MGTSRIEGHALSDSNLKSCNSTILKTSGRTCVAAFRGSAESVGYRVMKGSNLAPEVCTFHAGSSMRHALNLRQLRCGVAQHC